MKNKKATGPRNINGGCFGHLSRHLQSIKSWIILVKFLKIYYYNFRWRIFHLHLWGITVFFVNFQNVEEKYKNLIILQHSNIELNFYISISDIKCNKIIVFYFIHMHWFIFFLLWFLHGPPLNSNCAHGYKI